MRDEQAAPRQKIKETEKMWQSMDPRRFEAGGPAAAVHLSAPVVTHDGMFVWTDTPEEKAAKTADELLRSIGVSLG